MEKTIGLTLLIPGGTTDLPNSTNRGLITFIKKGELTVWRKDDHDPNIAVEQQYSISTQGLPKGYIELVPGISASLDYRNSSHKKIMSMLNSARL
jgi:hypothetical protein